MRTFVILHNQKRSAIIKPFDYPDHLKIANWAESPLAEDDESLMFY